MYSEVLPRFLPPFEKQLVTEVQWIMGYVGPGRIHPVEPWLLGGGRTHFSAAFGGAFELGQSSRTAVMQSVYECSWRRLQPLNGDKALVSVLLPSIAPPSIPVYTLICSLSLPKHQHVTNPSKSNKLLPTSTPQPLPFHLFTHLKSPNYNLLGVSSVCAKLRQHSCWCSLNGL